MLNLVNLMHTDTRIFSAPHGILIRNQDTTLIKSFLNSHLNAHCYLCIYFIYSHQTNWGFPQLSPTTERHPAARHTIMEQGNPIRPSQMQKQKETIPSFLSATPFVEVLPPTLLSHLIFPFPHFTNSAANIALLWK